MFRDLCERLIYRYRNGGASALYKAFLWGIRVKFERGRSSLLSRIPGIVIIVRIYVKIGHALFPTRYTDADPLKIVWIDPNSINYYSPHRFPVRVGRVYNGNWDLDTNSMHNKPVPRGLHHYFHNDINLEETEIYDVFVKKVEFNDAWGYSSPDQFDQRRQDIENLYEQIKKEGYKRSRELSDDRNDIHPVLDDEIRVDIGRKGEFFWQDCGQHRLIVAQQLDIDKVPVYIAARHAEWQSLRNNLRDGVTEGCKYLDHPDLTDLQ